MMATHRVRNLLLTAIAVVLVAAFPSSTVAQTKTLALDSLEGLKLVNVKAEPVTYEGRKAIRVTGTRAPSARPPAGAVKPPAAGAARTRPEPVHTVVLLSGTEFTDGVIEVDIAGRPREGSAGGARGFIGVAFRVAPDASKFECFYLRPTNGRAEDQERRNHAVQYVSVPEYEWFRLRKENPGKYESYADLVPGEWTKVKIEVRGEKARLYVHGNEQPTLLVNDLKLGQASGAIALWINASTEGYFSNLRISQ